MACLDRCGRIAVVSGDRKDVPFMTMVQAIRLRPNMYVGPLDSPSLWSELVEQVMCAALDDAVSGSCTRIIVTLLPDGAISVEDDGSGWDVSETKDGVRRAEVLMTVLGVCRASRKNEQVGKKFCGLGIAAVNALSSFCRFETRRDGSAWEQQYRVGEAVTPFTRVASASSSGSKLTFVPDMTILRGKLDVGELEKRLEVMRDEAPGCWIELIDRRD